MPSFPAENCAIVTVHMIGGGQRAEIVVPFGNPDEDLSYLVDPCEEIVESFITGGPLDALQQCISEDAQIVGVSCELMTNGGAPYRRNFALGTYPGARAAGLAPQQVAALVAYYPANTDVPEDTRTPVARNFIPFLAESDLTAEILIEDLRDQLEAFNNAVLSFTVNFPVPRQFTRCMKILRDVGATIVAVQIARVRDYVGTIRRRLLPHA